jgi:hypothetical protein
MLIHGEGVVLIQSAHLRALSSCGIVVLIGVVRKVGGVWGGAECMQ